jgi:hypothetical protein
MLSMAFPTQLNLRPVFYLLRLFFTFVCFGYGRPTAACLLADVPPTST